MKKPARQSGATAQAAPALCATAHATPGAARRPSPKLRRPGPQSKAGSTPQAARALTLLPGH